MGDEVHSRNSAATSLFFAAVAIPLIESGLDRGVVKQILNFVGNNSQFFLNLSMVSSKGTMDTAHGIANSSIVTAISRNGVTTAIRVSGLGEDWFEAPSDMSVGLFFPGFAEGDANPDLGDSAIAETAGFGGLSWRRRRRCCSSLAGTWLRRYLTRGKCMASPTRNPAMLLLCSTSWVRQQGSTSEKLSTPVSARY